MKKLFTTLALATVVSLSTFAADGGKKTDDASNVSYTVLNQFSSDFRGAKNVVWTVNANCQKAEFIVDDVKMTAFYKLTGEYMGVTQNVNYKSLPSAAKQEIETKYKGYQVAEVIKYQVNVTADYFDRLLTSSTESTVYFVDLKSQSEEMIVKVSTQGDVNFFKQVK
jgi:predicted transcriptional regulator